MTRMFVIIGLLGVLVAGGIFWLASYAVNHPPKAGPQVIEVDLNV